MSVITLDFSGVKTYMGLHEYMKQAFDLPDYYGHNLDALWDCLYCCYDSKTEICLKNLNQIPSGLVDEVRSMIELFQELSEKDGVVVRLDTNAATNLSDYFV